MTLYYAASSGGFYDDDIHTIIPKDAVEIGSETRSALLKANSQGARIEPNEKGYPKAVFPTEDEQAQCKAEAIRTERNAKLKESDWTQLSDIRLSALHAPRDQWEHYRQALRDIPQQPGFPDAVVWPPPPVE